MTEYWIELHPFFQDQYIWYNMNIGKTTTVGILFWIALFTPIIYAKYASVNVIMFTLRGSLDNGSPLVNVRLLQTIFGFVVVNLSSGNATPIDIVMKQLRSNIAKNIIPFISELNNADRAKKLINTNGANLNPIYIIDFTFNTLIIVNLQYCLIQIQYIFEHTQIWDIIPHINVETYLRC